MYAYEPHIRELHPSAAREYFRVVIVHFTRYIGITDPAPIASTMSAGHVITSPILLMRRFTLWTAFGPKFDKIFRVLHVLPHAL